MLKSLAQKVFLSLNLVRGFQWSRFGTNPLGGATSGTCEAPGIATPGIRGGGGLPGMPPGGGGMPGGGGGPPGIPGGPGGGGRPGIPPGGGGGIPGGGGAPAPGGIGGIPGGGGGAPNE